MNDDSTDPKNGPEMGSEMDPEMDAGAAPDPRAARTAAYNPTPEPVVRRGARPTTIVWGLILVIVGGGLIVSQLAAIHIEAGTALIGLLGLAGLLLVIGAVIGAVRARPARTEPIGSVSGD